MVGLLMCPTHVPQMAAREAAASGDSAYLLRGKLTALDLLVRVMDNPLHHWEVRPVDAVWMVDFVVW